ncbi:MAG: GYD domain-containing protein [Chloroflexi bacterium]|nr:GYD domain-containing protein [Chloroflexota bacterium]
MATYIGLLNYTQEGIANIKESPNRLDVAKKAAKAMGAKIKDFYLVMSQYDMVITMEAPDDETVARFVLAVGSGGAIRTQSFRAFTEDEYRQVIASLP